MNSRTQKFGGAALVFLAVIYVAWLALRRVEPAYDGKPLTAWAQQYGSNNWTGPGRLMAGEAEFAIRRIGTNSIPFLLHLMQARESGLKKNLRQRIPRKWHETLHLNDDSGTIRRIGAHGLAALGTNAPAAVPGLISIATKHPDNDGRYIAVFALRTIGPAAEAAVPFYIQCLTNQDNTIRNEAAVGLALIPQRRETALPALLKYFETIQSSQGWELYHAIELMGRFGTNASAAVPRLISLIDDPNPNVREAITNSLLRIDPDTAAKAHVRPRQP